MTPNHEFPLKLQTAAQGKRVKTRPRFPVNSDPASMGLTRYSGAP